jgi:hypothetical protein
MTMSKDELSLLLYLETRAVDYGGRVDTRRIKDEDFVTAKHWDKDGFIIFKRRNGRVVTRDGSSHQVTLSDEAWTLAHAERRTRCERITAKCKERESL